MIDEATVVEIFAAALLTQDLGPETSLATASYVINRLFPGIKKALRERGYEPDRQHIVALYDAPRGKLTVVLGEGPDEGR